MSLRPTALAVDRESQTGLYVVVDDPGTNVPLLIPASFEHRRIDVTREELYGGRFEIYPARAAGEPVEHRRSAERREALTYITAVAASYAVAIVGVCRLFRFIRRTVGRS